MATDDRNPKETDAESAAKELARHAEETSSFLAELWLFLRHNKKWWILPILIVILAASALVILVGTAGPLLYPGL